MEKQFLIAGFGGQGVLLIGQLIAKAAMRQGYEVSWMPSYGPEMRGGEANCAVVVSDEPIGSPLVSEPPVLVAMNKPSLMKFMPMMPAGGTLLYNASLIEGVELRTDVTVIPVACNEVAEQLGNGHPGRRHRGGRALQRHCRAAGQQPHCQHGHAGRHSGRHRSGHG